MAAKTRTRNKLVRRTITIAEFETSCEQCGKTFWGQRATVRYCSPNCRAKAHYQRRKEPT